MITATIAATDNRRGRSLRAVTRGRYSGVVAIGDDRDGDSRLALRARFAHARPHAAARCVLVLSDIHLAPILRHERLPYRAPEFAPDVELSAVIDAAIARAAKERAALEIVLNGDVFDLDVAADERDASNFCAHCDVRSNAGAAESLEHVVRDHPSFILALRRALASGARVVVLPGNHDAQLAMPAPRAVLRAAIGKGLVFRSWCYAAAGGLVLVEHGHQYDPLCALSRLIPDGRTEATVGTVSSFYGPLLLRSDPFMTDPFAERRGVIRAIREAIAEHGSAPLLRCARDLFAASIDRPPPDDVRALAALAGLDPELAALRRTHFAPKATIAEVVDAAAGAIAYGREVERATDRAMTCATDVHEADVAVVGHTHAPGSRVLPNGATLLNAGAWTPRRDPDAPVGTYAWVATHGPTVLSADVVAVRRS